MRQLIGVSAIAGAILVLSGCGAPRPVKYYTVQIPAAPTPTTYTYPVAVVVGRVTGPDLLEASPIVYRTGHNVLSAYQYHHWTEPAVNMVQAKLVRLLRTSGQYQTVGSIGSVSGAEFMVRGRLYELTEVDGDGITGLVTMEFELYDRRNSKILWSHFYSQAEPVKDKNVPAVVQALDRNLDRGLREVVDGLGQYFARNPPSKSAAALEANRNEGR